MEALRPKGPFFQSPYPDYYAANAMLLAARTIVAHPRPPVLIGISPKSFGFYYHNRREGEGVEFLQNFPSPEMRARLASTWVPGSNMNDSWLCAMETLSMNFPERGDLPVSYRRYRLLQYQATLREHGLRPLLRHVRWWEPCFTSRQSSPLHSPMPSLAACAANPGSGQGLVQRLSALRSAAPHRCLPRHPGSRQGDESRGVELSAAKVSICIPAYNHAEYLGPALESALAQTYSDLEIVVSDNQSTDNTGELVAGFGRRNDRIRYFRAPEHLSMQENFNHCLALARGRYIKFLCADDLLEPYCVERLLETLEGDESVKLAACARRLFSDGSRNTRVARYATRGLAHSGEEAIRRCFFRGNLIGEPTAVMFRREDAGAGFNPRFSQLVDLELWFRILETGRFAFVPDVLCSIREHRGQTTRRSVASGAVTRDKELLHADFSRQAVPRWNFRRALAVGFPYGLVCPARARCRLRR